jgi:CRP/FNR family transcriptional regulator, cyclic AMP receptor protein
MAAEDQLYQRFGKSFPKGTVLFRDGDEGSEMFVIRAGKIAISKTAGTIEKLLVTLGAGEFFGEMSILNNKPRTATATVAEDAQLLVIDPKTFEAMIRSSAEIAVRMIKSLATRLADTDAQIENLLLKDSSSRLVHFLLHSAETRGVKEAAGTRVSMQIADLPAELDLTPQQLKEAMQKVARAGLVKFEMDGFVVSDIKLLKDFQDFLQMKEKFGETG